MLGNSVILVVEVIGSNPTMGNFHLLSTVLKTKNDEKEAKMAHSLRNYSSKVLPY